MFTTVKQINPQKRFLSKYNHKNDWFQNRYKKWYHPSLSITQLSGWLWNLGSKELIIKFIVRLTPGQIYGINSYRRCNTGARIWKWIEINASGKRKKLQARSFALFINIQIAKATVWSVALYKFQNGTQRKVFFKFRFQMYQDNMQIFYFIQFFRIIYKKYISTIFSSWTDILPE